ncbi:hypothetical protein F5984_25380 [Rudanella paleaurantiibacter]|uniref:VWFA domain-containing protein n=1 Tax=Rudanella paleaurantiibacter TaxID=2614655 RepID=A0A7J5TUB9_9BACT|nr:VWA domain-containing protein [Rudanella paleaurantiibacter]KAB7725992.1 hypothetical protein F5984_25380 [Rudanella paleaurantiibacter]
MSDLIYTGNRLPSNHLLQFADMLAKASSPTVKPRPYTARVSRTTPTAFMFLLDQSGSMDKEVTVKGQTVSKATLLANSVNDLLNQLISECRREGEYRNYIDVCVIGYGADNDATAKYAWQGNLEGQSMVTIQALKDNAVERQGTKGKWISPKAGGLTPMRQALDLAHDTLVQWLASHAGKDIYPPVVINITDGVATDADAAGLIAAARKLRNLRTVDGNVLLYNVHLTAGHEEPFLFPCQKEELPEDEYAYLLFDMSSDLPALYNAPIAKITNRDANPSYTAMALNANPIQLVQLLNIGTSVSRRQHV